MEMRRREEGRQEEGFWRGLKRKLSFRRIGSFGGRHVRQVRRTGGPVDLMG